MDFLPPECLLHILKFIPGDDLLQCSLVSRKFNQIIKSNGSSLQKRKMSLLKIARNCKEDNVLEISEKFLDDSEMSVGFVKGKQENRKENVFCKEGRIDNQKIVETPCVLTTLERFISRRMARTDYQSLITSHLSHEEMSTIGRVLDKNTMIIKVMEVNSADKTQLDTFLATETTKKVDRLYLSTSDGHYFIPDEIFKQLSFTKFSSSIMREISVFLSFSQIIWILKEWKENRRQLKYLTVYTPVVENDAFHAELNALGFVNEDHRDSSFKINMRGNTMMTLKWDLTRGHIFMNFVAERIQLSLKTMLS